MQKLTQGCGGYSRGLEQLRGIAAFSVWWHHFGYAKMAAFLPGFMAVTANAGEWGVDIFLIMSGFLFGQISQQKPDYLNWWPFMRDRLFRIMPMFFIIIMVAAAVRWDSFHAAQLADFLTFFPLSASTLIGDSYADLLYPAWTLGTEMICYAILPFFAAAYFPDKRRSALGVILALTLIGLPLILAKSGHVLSGGVLYSFLYNAPKFFLGFMLGRILTGRTGSKPVIGAVTCLLALIVLFGTGSFLETGDCFIGKKPRYFLNHQIFLPLISTLIVLGAYWSGGLGGIGGKITEGFGTVSYSFYLLHVLVTSTLLRLPIVAGFIPEHPALAVICLGLLPAAVLSALTYNTIEKPFIELGRRIRAEQITCYPGAEVLALPAFISRRLR